jgi:hypothetical protein
MIAMLAVVLFAAGCGDDEASTTTTIAVSGPTTTTTLPENLQVLEVGQSYSGQIAGGMFPDNTASYSLEVPAGTRVTLGIREFETDLDLYADTDASLFQQGRDSDEDMGTYQSNQYGNGKAEQITLEQPGTYYIQVVSFEALADSFTIYAELAEN